MVLVDDYYLFLIWTISISVGLILAYIVDNNNYYQRDKEEDKEACYKKQG